MNKLLIFSAPSGSGKTTIVNHLLKTFDTLSFSISATSREQRPGEVDGINYYFLTPDEFRQKIEENAFVEWEEVYPNQYYGTLKSELERIWAQNQHVIFDVDVVGGIKIKHLYPEQSLAVFVKPPSVEALEARLMSRKTESEEALKRRIAKAEQELKYQDQFDLLLINDDLQQAKQEAVEIAEKFLNDD
ncbi:MAG: guanylate kinase [Bacteroidales bacterium]|nr:guanylate kinase [Bacteroidales bacterium]MCF8332596.1 guanylate kinase [Bacteroidales bacterium]